MQEESTQEASVKCEICREPLAYAPTRVYRDGHTYYICKRCQRVLTQTGWLVNAMDEKLEQLKRELVDLLRRSSELLTELEHAKVSHTELEKMASVIVGLQIALDGMNNQYGYER